MQDTKKNKIAIWAENVTRFIQGMIGVSIGIAAINKLVVEGLHLVFPSMELHPAFIALLEAKMLDLVAEGLLASAAIELAHMLITPDLDEAVDPLILGLAATIVFRIEAARESHGDIIYQPLQILIYICALAGLFTIREIFIRRTGFRPETSVVRATVCEAESNSEAKQEVGNAP